MRKAFIATLLVSVVGLGSSAKAAEFRQTVRDDSVLIQMSGQIEEGDLSRLLASIKQAEEHREPPFEGSVILSLNSPGGSYSTGLAMSKAVRSKGIGTIVKAGSECYSACALVFMHGTGITYDMEPYVNRDMEPGARIGFHAPFLNLGASGERFEGGMVAAAYTVALRQFSHLLESGENVLSTDLLVKILRAGPDEAVMVDTYGDAMHWNIRIAGMVVPKRILHSDMYLICQNLWDDKHKRRPTATKAQPNTPEADLMTPASVGRRADGYEVYRYSMDDLNGISCSLGVKRDDAGSLDVVLLDMSESGERATGFERYVPLTFWHEGSEPLPAN